MSIEEKSNEMKTDYECWSCGNLIKPMTKHVVIWDRHVNGSDHEDVLAELCIDCTNKAELLETMSSVFQIRCYDQSIIKDRFFTENVDGFVCATCQCVMNSSETARLFVLSEEIANEGGQLSILDTPFALFCNECGVGNALKEFHTKFCDHYGVNEPY